jgi:hypothetical protein
MNKKNTITGDLPYHANVGEHNIKTSEPYQDPQPTGKDHTSHLRQEVQESARFGGGKVYSKQTYKLDVDLIQKRRKELKITQTGIYKKMKLSTVTFYNAINGGRVQKHCVERFAELLGVSEEELIIGEK